MRKGSIRSQTIGYKMSASNANGQQKKKRISQRIKVVIGIFRFYFIYDNKKKKLPLTEDAVIKPELCNEFKNTLDFSFPHAILRQMQYCMLRTSFFLFSSFA